MNLTWALLSHYRRHPLQLLALVLILVAATALWSGVWNLSQQARASFMASESALDSRFAIRRTDGHSVSVADFARLRRLGYCVTPQLVVERPAPAGRLIGVDGLSLSCFDETDTFGSARAPSAFVDIGEAERTAGDRWPTRLTLFIRDQHSDLPSDYRIEVQVGGVATEQLADSFLLNLDALCALVLLISALLVRSVFSLGLAQRERVLVLLQRHGVSLPRLRWQLVAELAVLTLIGGSVGLLLGRILADGYAQGFEQVLTGLFDVALYNRTVSVWSWLTPLLMLVVVMVWAVSDRLFNASPVLSAQRAVGLAVTVLVVGTLVIVFSSSLAWQFVAIGLVLAGYGWLWALLLPSLLSRLANRSPHPLRRWSWGEVSVMIRKLALPLVALQFAAATVIAVHALVATFESTFYHWLDQRLQGDVYVQAPSTMSRAQATQTLSSLDRITEVHGALRGTARWAHGELDIMAVEPDSPLLQHWKFLAGGDAGVQTVWQAVSRGSVLVNEQLARRQQLTVGDTLSFTLGSHPITAPIVAIYADYGRPAGEVVMSQAAWPEDVANASLSFSVRLDSNGIQSFQQQLKVAWQVPDITVRDNEEIRTLAVRIFDQTFALTRAISAMTLLLAGLSLFLMALTMFGARRWYYQLLQVWGLPASRVRGWLMRHGILLTGMVSAVALPLGVFLTWVLVARINPLAFGWSLPMAIFPRFWLLIFLLCVLLGLLLTGLLVRQITLGSGFNRTSDGPLRTTTLQTGTAP